MSFNHLSVLAENNSVNITIIKMKLWFLALCMCLVGLSGASLHRERRSSEEPPFSKTLHEGFEERVYKPRKWVCSDYNNNESAERISAYMRLHYYTQGNNTKGKIIPRTKPVAIEIKKTDSNVETYTYCFFITNEFQNDPPTPLDASVYIKDRPLMTIFTRRFGGFANDVDFRTEETELREILANENHIIEPNHVIRAMYSPPWVKKNRRNELWLLKA